MSYFKKIETLVELNKCLRNSQKWLENASNGRLADAGMTKEDQFKLWQTRQQAGSSVEKR